MDVIVVIILLVESLVGLDPLNLFGTGATFSACVFALFVAGSNDVDGILLVNSAFIILAAVEIVILLLLFNRDFPIQHHY